MGEPPDAAGGEFFVAHGKNSRTAMHKRERRSGLLLTRSWFAHEGHQERVADTGSMASYPQRNCLFIPFAADSRNTLLFLLFFR